MVFTAATTGVVEFGLDAGRIGSEVEVAWIEPYLGLKNEGSHA